MQGCASVSLMFEYDPFTQAEYGGTTYASIRVSNLQGAEAWLPNPGAYSLNTLSFEYLTATTTISGIGGGGVIGGLPWTYSGAEGDAGPGNAGWERFLTYDDHEGPFEPGRFGWHRYAGSRFMGCDRPEVSGVPSTAYTCGGALTYRSTWTGRVAFTDMTRLSITLDPMGYGQFDEPVRCTVGTDCITVTPEPSTWVMLATGLLCLGWFARRRRAGLAEPGVT
jgi:hypothetical protein